MSTSTLQPNAYPAGDGVADFLPRIAAAAAHARQLDEARALAHRQRNELMVEAVDAGVSQRAVAKAAGVAKSRVMKLLTLSQDDDGDLEVLID